ncbi:hypothetical protein V8G54_020772 [Vigna mungo]|uniref:Uncharacterized protein n=1 Tax=Vigna mungo TaxID=3915 RepID=A0AAQ3RX30_VIGMU
MGRQRTRTHGPSDLFSGSDFLLGPQAGRRNLVHLPEGGGELPGRHRSQTRLGGGLRRRVLGGGGEWAERRSRGHELPGGHGRTGSAPLPNQNSPLEAVVVKQGGGGGGRGGTTSFSDLARNHVHGDWVLVPRHEIRVT